jgi:hypothetical protein
MHFQIFAITKLLRKKVIKFVKFIWKLKLFLRKYRLILQRNMCQLFVKKKSINNVLKGFSLIY